MRGQTTLDFAIGISIFLLVILFVFAFVPGLLQPFSASGADHGIVAGQVADRLSQGLLGDPSDPYVLDRHCTVEFFSSSPSNIGRCRFDSGGIGALRLETGTNLNVTLENTSAAISGSGLLCWDEGAHEMVFADAGACDTSLSLGDAPPPANDATITARRVVALDGESVTMKVVVW